MAGEDYIAPFTVDELEHALEENLGSDDYQRLRAIAESVDARTPVTEAELDDELRQVYQD